jgi:hypothetical protein
VALAHRIGCYKQIFEHVITGSAFVREFDKFAKVALASNTRFSQYSQLDIERELLRVGGLVW